MRAYAAVVVGVGRVWVSSYGTNSLQWVDPATNAVSAPCKGGDLYWVDATTNAVTGPWPTTTTTQFVIDAAPGVVWAADFAGTTLVRIDTTRLH